MKLISAKSCHALAQLLISEEKALESGNSTSAAVAEIAAKVEVPSLLMKSCQWGNWEACTTFGVLSLEVTRLDLKSKNEIILGFAWSYAKGRSWHGTARKGLH